MIFEQKRTNKAGPTDFWPYLPRGERETLGEEREAWRFLFHAMKEGRVPAFGKRWGQGDEEIKIPPEEFDGLDWGMHGEMPGLRRRAATQDEDEHLSIDADIKFTDVMVSSGAMISNFIPGGEPIAFNTTHIGPPESPDGPDFMPLSAAAYWIATKGGTLAFFARDEVVWKSAYKALLAEIVGGQIKVVGRHEKEGFAEQIDGFRFSGIEIDYPYPAIDDETSINLMFGDRPFLRCGPPVITADWQHHNDSLRGGKSATRLTHLQVSKPDIARLWSFLGSSEPNGTTEAPKPRIVERAEIEEAYKRWISEKQRLNQRTSREEDFIYMRYQFPGIVTVRRARELRERFAPKEWRQGGRPSNR
jgi:hypothetical protein